MPRNYKCKTISTDGKQREKKHSQVDLDNALHMLNDGSSIRKASKASGLNESTLRYKLKALKASKVPISELRHMPSVKRGNKSSLPVEAEISLAMMARLTARWGLGLDSDAIKQLVAEYVSANREKDTDIGQYLRQYCRFKV